MNKTILALAIVCLFIIPALGVAPNGIMNKFDNFVDCFQGIDKECNQFDYFKDGVVGFDDFGKFIQKFTKMVKG